MSSLNKIGKGQNVFQLFDGVNGAAADGWSESHLIGRNNISWDM